MAPLPAEDTGNEPAVDAETVNLQLCSTQLPVAKAQRVLGYDPLPTAEGFRRTNSWLASAGFHPIPETRGK